MRAQGMRIEGMRCDVSKAPDVQAVVDRTIAVFGKEIWEELAEKGYLKRDGMGFYELVPGK